MTGVAVLILIVVHIYNIVNDRTTYERIKKYKQSRKHRSRVAQNISLKAAANNFDNSQ